MKPKYLDLTETKKTEEGWRVSDVSESVSVWIGERQEVVDWDEEPKCFNEEEVMPMVRARERMLELEL